jgi:hypothetical protein
VLTAEEEQVASRAKKIYDERLRAQLESTNLNAYVAIEPESGEFFVANSLREADDAAQMKFPNRLTYVLRIGHNAVFHIGAAK